MFFGKKFKFVIINEYANNILMISQLHKNSTGVTFRCKIYKKDNKRANNIWQDRVPTAKLTFRIGRDEF